jgi:hypothetical protein
MASFLSAPLSHRLSPLILSLLFVLGMKILPIMTQPQNWTETIKDPDAILRLVVVDNLIQTGDWGDHKIHRTNPPTGTVTPWTRPMDGVVLAGYAPMRLFLDEKQALIASAMIMPPLLFVLGLVLVWRWMASQGMPIYAQLFVLMAMIMNPWFTAFDPGAVDHHGLLLVCAWLQFLLTYSVIQGKEDHAPYLAMVTGLGIWVSPEFFIVSFLSFAGLAFCWLRRPAEYHAPFLNVLGITTLILAVAVGIEQPVLSVLFYDTVSVVYVALLALVTLGFWALKATERHDLWDRLFFAMGTLIMIIGVMLRLYPEFYKLTMGGLDPYIIKSFLPVVSEQQPLMDSFKDIFPPQPWVGMVAVNLFFLVGYGFFFHRLRVARGQLFQGHSPDLFVFGYAVVTLGLGMAVVRLYPYAFLPAVFLFLPVLDALVKTRKLSALSDSLRACCVIIMAALPVFGLAFLMSLATIWPSSQKDGVDNACDEDTRVFIQKALMPALPQAHLIFTHNNDMPALLFWTRYTALAGNYHREPAALKDLATFFSAKTEREAQALIQKHRPDAVIVCLKRAQPAGRWIYDVATGKIKAPSDMKRIPTDEALYPNIRLYQVGR